MNKICFRCKTGTDFHKNKNKADGLAVYCKKCAYEFTTQWRKRNLRRWCGYYKNTKHYDNSKKRRLRDKQLVFNHYGNKCNCCGEDNVKFLTIDHKNNDGYKTKGKKANNYEYAIRLKLPDYLQLSCWNCNSGRQLNGGICPHKEVNQV